MDLAVPDAPQALYEKVAEMDITVDVLINNAGIGIYGNFIDIHWDREKDMLMLDLINPVHQTKLFVRQTVARNFGCVLNITSTGAYQPSPFYASYAAAKSFVLSFTEALN
jgi:short-subunit dehydrogenase